MLLLAAVALNLISIIFIIVSLSTSSWFMLSVSPSYPLTGTYDFKLGLSYVCCNDVSACSGTCQQCMRLLP
jgi:hypothetical protein